MVVIIGAGPIGLAVAIELKKRGIQSRIIERGALVDSIFNYPVNMTFFSTSDKLEIGNIPFISHGPKPTRSEALEYYRRADEHFELDIRVYEEVQSVEGDDGNFTVLTSKGSHKAEKVVLATGFYGQENLMNIPGEELEKVEHYYDEPHKYAWQNVVVVRDAISAADEAPGTYRCSAHVTMVIRDSQMSLLVQFLFKPDCEIRNLERSFT